MYAIADEQQLTMMNVFHAGDGNLHPLIVFDAREPGVWERVHRAGDEILAACVAAGGVLSGEHGIGLEKREAMPLIFGPDDLDAQARLRDAFDPSGRANPQKILPAGVGAASCSGSPRGRGSDGDAVEAWPDGGRDAATESTDLMVAVTAVDDLRELVAQASAVAAVGSRTHWEVGGPPPRGDDLVLVTAPDGVVAYDPADLTVTIGAGTRCDELADVLGAEGQESALDPRDGGATVGGVLATGLSGHRRLRLGPLRDRLLEVRFVTADGRLVKGGGPTVKNVSGYDLPRLLVGSLGTIGVMVQVTLRCQPRAATSEWFTTDADPFALRRDLYRPSCLAWDGATTHVLLEGVAADVDAERVRIGAPAERSAGPAWPTGPHRGRMSVRPRALTTLAPELRNAKVRWLAEVGVGTVHVAADDERALARARAVAESVGGWMLREAGAPGLDGFGVALPNAGVSERIRTAFDPTGTCSPGRSAGAGR